MIELALIIQTLLWLIAIGIFAASRQASVFHPVTLYLGFHGLVFVARPILVYSFGLNTISNYMQYRPTQEIFIKTLEVTSVALFVFVAAGLLAGRSRLVYGSPQPPEFTPLERRALLITTLLLLPLMAWSIYATRNGVQGERAANGIFIMTNSTGYINEAQDFIGPLLCVWMVVTRFHWLYLLPSVLYIGYRTWYGWSRWTILLFFLLVILVYCWYHRRKWSPLWSVAAAIPILLLFNLIGHNRDMFKSVLTGEDTHVAEFDAGMSADEKLKAQFDTQDFANFDYLCFIVRIYSERPDAYSYGAQYLQLFTEPIPRILWRGKPAGAPVASQIDLFQYGNFIGLTYSMPGDGFVTGGWIGVIVIVSLWGSLMGWAHRVFWRNTENRLGSLMYLVGLAMVPQEFRDGSISIAKFLLFNVTPIMLWQGMIWWLGPRRVPGYSAVLPRGAGVRWVRSWR